MEKDLIDELLNDAVENAVHDEAIDDLLNEVTPKFLSEEPEPNPKENAPSRVHRKKKIIFPPRKITNPQYVEDATDLMIYLHTVRTISRKNVCVVHIPISDNEYYAMDGSFMLKSVSLEKFPALALPPGVKNIHGNNFPKFENIHKNITYYHPVVKDLSFNGYCLKGSALLNAVLFQPTTLFATSTTPRKPKLLEFYLNFDYPSNISIMTRDRYLISEAERIYNGFLDEINTYVNVESNNTRLKFISRNSESTTIVLEYMAFQQMKSFDILMAAGVKPTKLEDVLEFAAIEETLRFYHRITCPGDILCLSEIAPLNMVYTGNDVIASQECIFSIALGIVPVDISIMNDESYTKLKECSERGLSLWFLGLDNAKIHSRLVESGDTAVEIGKFRLNKCVNAVDKRPYFNLMSIETPLKVSDIASGLMGVAMDDEEHLGRKNLHAIIDNEPFSVGSTDLKAFRNREFLRHPDMIDHLIHLVVHALTLETVDLDKVFDYDDQCEKSFHKVRIAVAFNDNVAFEKYILDYMTGIISRITEQIIELNTGILWKIIGPRKKTFIAPNPRTFYPEGMWNGCELTLAWDLKRIIILAKYKPQENCWISMLSKDNIKLIFAFLDLMLSHDIVLECNDYMNHSRECSKIQSKHDGLPMADMAETMRRMFGGNFMQ